jgi:hypothetical protein
MMTDTNSDSKIERGYEEEATEAYILVRRGDDNEVNEVKSMKGNWYERNGRAREPLCLFMLFRPALTQILGGSPCIF